MTEAGGAAAAARRGRRRQKTGGAAKAAGGGARCPRRPAAPLVDTPGARRAEALKAGMGRVVWRGWVWVLVAADAATSSLAGGLSLSESETASETWTRVAARLRTRLSSLSSPLPETMLLSSARPASLRPAAPATRRAAARSPTFMAAATPKEVRREEGRERERKRGSGLTGKRLSLSLSRPGRTRAHPPTRPPALSHAAPTRTQGVPGVPNEHARAGPQTRAPPRPGVGKSLSLLLTRLTRPNFRTRPTTHHQSFTTTIASKLLAVSSEREREREREGERRDKRERAQKSTRTPHKPQPPLSPRLLSPSPLGHRRREPRPHPAGRLRGRVRPAGLP